MPYDEKAAERVRQALSGHRDVIEKRLMGGLVFMLNGNMCCGVSRSALMVRVGPEDYSEMLAEPHVRPLEFGGKRPKGYLLVDPDGCRTKPALEKWVARAVTFTSTLPRK